jgi:hypothetical protein
MPVVATGIEHCRPSLLSSLDVQSNGVDEEPSAEAAAVGQPPSLSSASAPDAQSAGSTRLSIIAVACSDATIRAWNVGRAFAVHMVLKTATVQSCMRWVGHSNLLLTTGVGSDAGRVYGWNVVRKEVRAPSTRFGDAPALHLRSRSCQRRGAAYLHCCS